MKLLFVKRMSLIVLLAVGAAVLLLWSNPAMAQGPDSKIAVGNASQLKQLHRLGRGLPSVAAFAKDGKTIGIGSTVGVWLYAADTLDTPTEPPLLITKKPVSAVSFSPDGKLLAAGTERQIVIWEVATQKETASYEAKVGVNALTFSPDGKLLAYGGDGNSVYLLDAASGAVKAELKGHTSSVMGLAFRPDGSVLASGGYDQTIRLWTMPTGKEKAVLKGHTGYIYGLAFSPDGKLLASASADKMVRLWDAASGREKAVLKGHTDYVYHVAFSPDGKTLASGSSDETVRLWDGASGKEGTVLKAETGDIKNLAFSPDNSQLVTVSDEQVVQLWDVAAGTVLKTALGHADEMNTVAFSPDGKTLSLGNDDGKVWIWDIKAAAEIHAVPVLEEALGATATNTTYLAYAPNGKFIATIEGFSAVLWDPVKGTQLQKLDGKGLTSSLAISPDSSLVVYVGSDGMFVFEAESGKLLASLTDHTAWVKSVAFSPDQALLATASDDGTVRVWGIQ